MAIQAVSGNGGWEQFVKLASAARVRNSGFSGSINAPTQQQSATATASPISSRFEQVHSAKRSYPMTGEKPHRAPMVGTRFDAYA